MTDLNDVKAGKYRLTAPRWRMITSKPGEPYDYVQYRAGDIVELTVEDARRLTVAGAVEPVAAARRATAAPPVSPPSTSAPAADPGTADPGTGGGSDAPASADAHADLLAKSIKDIVEAVGTDVELAAALMAAESSAETPRSGLLTALAKVVEGGTA